MRACNTLGRVQAVIQDCSKITVLRRAEATGKHRNQWKWNNSSPHSIHDPIQISAALTAAYGPAFNPIIGLACAPPGSKGDPTVLREVRAGGRGGVGRRANVWGRVGLRVAG